MKKIQEHALLVQTRAMPPSRLNSRLGHIRYTLGSGETVRPPPPTSRKGVRTQEEARMESKNSQALDDKHRQISVSILQNVQAVRSQESEQ